MLSEKTKEIIQQLKKTEGTCRGVSLQTPLEYIRITQGQETVNKIEDELKKIGLPVLKEIKSLEYYPLSYMTILHLVIKETLNWGDEQIKMMGYALPQISIIVKMIMKYFLSIKRTFETCPVYWAKHFSVGELVPAEINEEKKYLILHLKNYKTHPIDCKLFEGYFSRIGEYVIKSKKVTTEETKCLHRGDTYHEFIIKWE